MVFAVMTGYAASTGQHRDIDLSTDIPADKAQAPIITLKHAYDWDTGIVALTAAKPVTLTKSVNDASHALIVNVGAGTGLAAQFLGASVSSPGAGAGSERYGAGALAGGPGSAAFGPGVSVAGTNSVGIGGASTVVGGGNSVGIGVGAVVPTDSCVGIGQGVLANAGNVVVVGANSQDNGLGDGVTVGGNSATTGDAFACVLVGANAGNNGSPFAVMIGDGANTNNVSGPIGIGWGVTVNFKSIVIATNGVATADHQAVFGSRGFETKDWFMSGGVTNTEPSALGLNATGGVYVAALSDPGSPPGVSVASSSGSFSPGDYNVAYTYVNCGGFGSTLVSPTSTITLGATDGILTADLTPLPAGVENVQWYVSNGPGPGPLQAYGGLSNGTPQTLNAPGSGASPPGGNNTYREGDGNTLTLNAGLADSTGPDLNNGASVIFRPSVGYNGGTNGDIVSTNIGDTAASDFVPIADNTGNVGRDGLRWALVRAAVVTPGDLLFENGYRITESEKLDPHAPPALVLLRPDGSEVTRFA